MHLASTFDVTSLCKLRKLGFSQKPTRGSAKAVEMRWAQVVFFKKVHVAGILSAFGLTEEAKVAMGPSFDGWAMATKAEQRLSDGSDAANAFWAAVGTGSDKNERVTMECFGIVRVLAGASGGGAGATGGLTAPPPTPPTPPGATTDGVYGLLFGFLSGDALVQAKMMALQLIFRTKPSVREYRAREGGRIRLGPQGLDRVAPRRTRARD